MANVSHASLTGSNLHEPKGADSATIGTVYVSDGAGSGAWVGLIPIGAVIFDAGNSAPSRYLYCYGQAVSRTTYAALFARIGTTYGSGDGSTTFNLPDIRGRVIAGQDDMGGTSANRLTADLDGDVLGATGGSETHTGQSVTVSGTTQPSGISHNVAAGSGEFPSSTSHTHNFTGTGTTGPGSSVQPTIILNAIIYTGVA